MEASRNRMKRKRFSIVIQCLSVLLACLGMCFPSVWGYERIVVESEEQPYLFWEDAAFPLVWYLDEDGSDDLDFDLLEDVLKGSFQTWQNVNCSYFSHQYGGPIDKQVSDFNAFSREADGTNLLIFTESDWPAEWDGAIAITVPMFYPNSGRVLEIDMIFNGQDFSWSTDPGGVSGKMDVANIATHEIGHFLGLDHSESLAATMYYSTSTGLTVASTLSADDIQGVCAIYPVEGENGAFCEADEDCNAARCIEHEASGGKVCASNCICDTDCPAYLGCESGSCLPPVAGDRVMGESCRDLLECQADLSCVVNAIGEEGYCTSSCSDDDPCPDGWFCRAANVGWFCSSLAPEPINAGDVIDITEVSFEPTNPASGDNVTATVAVELPDDVENVEYRFFLRHHDDWEPLQTYGDSSSLTFVPSSVGNWQLRAEVRRVGADSCYETKEIVGLTVLPGIGSDPTDGDIEENDSTETSSFSNNGGCFGRQMDVGGGWGVAHWVVFGMMFLWLFRRKQVEKGKNRQKMTQKIKN